MNWVDITILVLILLGITIGLWKGFFKSFLSMISSSIVFLLSFLLCKPTANWIMKITSWDTSLNAEIRNWLTNISDQFNVNMVGMQSEELTSHIKNTLSAEGFPSFFKFLFKTTTDLTPNDISHKSIFTMNDMISQTLTILTFMLICFIFFLIVFFLIKFILGYYTRRLSEKSPTFKNTDKAFGGIFGAARGLLWVCVIFAFVSIFRNYVFFADINGAINSSLIGKPISSWIYNIVDKYFDLGSMIKLISII